LVALACWFAVAGRPPLNVKVWLEGEEELGRPNLALFLDREARRLRADAVLVSDTQMLGPTKPALVYGLRGLLDGELEVRSGTRDLHSGLYGGAQPGALE